MGQGQKQWKEDKFDGSGMSKAKKKTEKRRS